MSDTGASARRWVALRRLATAVTLSLLAAAVVYPAPVAAAEGEPDLSAVPEADCGPGSEPETAEQGRVPSEDYESGRADEPYTCNTELLGHHGTTGG